MTAKYFFPAVLLSAFLSLTAPENAAADPAAWQVQQTSMIYQNSGMANSEGMLAGASARVGFDPKNPEDGTFDMTFSTTGLFLPRDVMATRDPEKLQRMATAATEGTVTATRMERRGDGINVTANITINGQSRPVTFNMKTAEEGNDAGRSLRLTGQFIINRPAFATKEIGYIGPANIPVKFDVMAMTAAAAPAEEIPAQIDPNAPANTGDIAAEPTAEPGTQAPVPETAPQRRLLTEEDIAEEKKKNPEIGVVRTFGGGAADSAPGNNTGGAAPYGGRQDDNTGGTQEVGKVRTFGGTP